MPIVGKAPVVQLVTQKPSLEERAKALLEGRKITATSLQEGRLKLSLDSGQTLEVFVGDASIKK